jgi:hypothetical protein
MAYEIRYAATYDAARHWAKRCLIQDASLFGDVEVWTKDYWKELDR